jgi:hypothetical protein
VKIRGARRARGTRGMPIAVMILPRPRVAARKRIAIAIVAMLLAAAPAYAESAPSLILPLVTALAIASAAKDAPRQVGTIKSGGVPITSLIPSRIQYQNGYSIDAGDLLHYAGRRRPAAIIDRDRLVWFDLFKRPESNFTMAAEYDDESRAPHRPSSELLRLVIERKF